MINVEVEFGAECSSDAQCDQVIPGTGVGCATDDVVVRIDYDSSHLFDFIEEAERAGCRIDFDTTGECPTGGEPSCLRGVCGWE